MERGSEFRVLYEGDHDETWLDMRRKTGVGASESPAILGLSPFGSSMELYARKVGVLGEIEDNEAMKWGRILEGAVLQEFSKEVGRNLRPDGRILQSIEAPYLICTPDAMDQHGVVQVKVSGVSKWWVDEIPKWVWGQVQHECAVTGMNIATVVVLVGGTKLLWQHVQRDNRFIETILMPQCEEFWRCVTERIPYMRTDGDQESVHRALTALYPKDTGGTIHLDDGAFVGLHNEREELRERKAATERRLAEIDNQFRARIGKATYAVLPNNVIYSLITTVLEPKLIERKGATYRTLRSKKGIENG